MRTLLTVLLSKKELVNNGKFLNGTTGWTAGALAGLSIVSGRLRITNAGATFGYAYQTIATLPGRKYNVVALGQKGTASLARVYAGTTAGSSNLGQAAPESLSSPAMFSFFATGTTTYISLVNGNEADAYNDYQSVSVR